MSTLPLTKVEGCPGRESVRPGMAYFHDTGPFATYCGECAHLQRMGRAKKCAMFKALTGKWGESVKDAYKSCKYFERPVKK